MGCGLFHIQLRYATLPLFMTRVYLLLRRGRYDIIHAQDDYGAGISMPLAWMAGIPRRLFHVHSTRFAFGPDSRMLHRWMGRLLRTTATRFSHACLCCSSAARDAFFEGEPPASARVLYCGIDLKPFRIDAATCRESVRSELGLDAETRLVLFAGRLCDQKNVDLLIRAMSRMEEVSDCVLLMAGDGPDRGHLEGICRGQGLDSRCRFLGFREDLPRLMLASDIFVLPSQYEGLGLVLVQAQAAGLPILASTAIPREVEVISQLFHWQCPEDPPETWARTIEAVLLEERGDRHAIAIDAIRGSAFNIDNCADALSRAYMGNPRRHRTAL